MSGSFRQQPPHVDHPASSRPPKPSQQVRTSHVPMARPNADCHGFIPGSRRAVLKKKKGHCTCQPAQGACLRVMSYGTKGLAFRAYGPYWRNLLNTSKIKSFAMLRRDEVESLVEWLKRATAVREVVDCWVILGKIRDDGSDLRGLIEEHLGLACAFNIADYVPYLAPLDIQGYTRHMKQVSHGVDKVLEITIVEHEQVALSKQQ
ncbi:Cytochrome P [Trema orientale]|uniref:Cytochrome P n=1 Tax=Trema orientale TaxID=63057 RepID=A0A2P5ELP3_TREOI|nr:Cytochrome P [Trema orientale]